MGRMWAVRARWHRPMPSVQWISATRHEPLLRCDPNRSGPRTSAGRSAAIESASTTMDFSEPLPIDAALPELTAALPWRAPRCWSGSAQRRQNHAVPLVLAGAREGQENPRARAAPARRRAAARPRMASTLGEAVGASVSYRVRLARRSRVRPHRGGDRRSSRASSSGSCACRRCCRAVRRVPRALARCRSRLGAGSRRAAGLREPQAPGHVGDA